MKRISWILRAGATAAVALIIWSSRSAFAAATSIQLYSNNQTYVVSSTAQSTMYPTDEADTNFQGKGAMMISAPVTDPNSSYASVPRAMDSLFSFNTATFSVGTSTAYVTNPVTGINLVSTFNAVYGAGNWNIVSVTATLASNWYVAGIQPTNDDFNKVASGSFNLSVLGVNPDLTTVTWNILQNEVLPSTTVTPVGTFQWNAQAVSTYNNANSEPTATYALAVNSSLTSAFLAGEITLLGVAADNGVGYLFNTDNRVAPYLTITANVAAPYPVPALTPLTLLMCVMILSGVLLKSGRRVPAKR